MRYDIWSYSQSSFENVFWCFIEALSKMSSMQKIFCDLSGWKMHLGSTCGTFSIRNFFPPMPTLYSNKILRRAKVWMWKGIVFQKWCGFQTVVELCWNDVSAGWWASGIVGVARRIVGRRSALPPPTNHTATGNNIGIKTLVAWIFSERALF